MPTYIYEVVTEDGHVGERFELVQRMVDPPLTEHPETGQPVRRVFVPRGFSERYRRIPSNHEVQYDATCLETQVRIREHSSESEVVDPSLPALCCPSCSLRFPLPEQPVGKPWCPKCGETTLSDPDAMTRAYIAAARRAIEPPVAKPSDAAIIQNAVRDPDGIELRDESGASICRLRPATEFDQRIENVGSLVDSRAIQHMLSQIPQAAFSAILLHQMSGQVVLSWAPEVAAQLAQSTANVMLAVTGGFRGQAVDVVTNQVIGQASFHPVSVTTLGLASGWQILSLVVAQKHLSDISARLEQIEQKVDELRELLDADLLAEIRGDAGHLVGIVRAVSASGSEPSGSRLEYSATADQIIRLARSRREKISDRVHRAAKTFVPNRGARYFGRTLGMAERALREDLDRFTRNVIAQRLNTRVMIAAIALLRQVSEDTAYTNQLDVDLDRWIAEDESTLPACFEPLEDAIMSVCGTFVRKNKTEAAARTRLASQVWIGSRTVSLLRNEVTRVHRTEDVSSPQLLLIVAEGCSVEKAVWLDTNL